MPVDVTTLGLIGDDAFDNSAVLQTAANGNDALYFPPGIYQTDKTTFTTRNRVHLVGEGVVKFKASAGALQQVFNFNACTHVLVDGLTFDGNKANQTQPPTAEPDWNGPGNRRQGTALEFDTCTHVMVRDCEFKDFTTVSIALGSSSYVSIVDNYFHDSYMDAIYTFDSSNSYVNIRGNHVRDLTYTYDYANGFLVNADDLIIDSNLIDNVDRSGTKPFDASGMTRAVLSNNIIRRCGFQGINPQAGSEISIMGNVITDIQLSGVLVSTASAVSNVLVQGNIIKDTGLNGSGSSREGISVISDVEKIRLLDNQIEDASRYGIRLYSPDQFDVMNNRIDNPGVAGIALWGDATAFPTNGRILRNDIVNADKREIHQKSTVRNVEIDAPVWYVP